MNVIKLNKLNKMNRINYLMAITIHNYFHNLKYLETQYMKHKFNLSCTHPI